MSETKEPRRLLIDTFMGEVIDINAATSMSPDSYYIWFVEASALDAANAEIALLKENVSSTLYLDHQWREKYFDLQSQLTAANAKVEIATATLKNIAFIPYSAGGKMKQTKESFQAMAREALEKIQSPLTEEEK